MNQIIEYLKSPELVIKVQEFFGIKYVKQQDIATDKQSLLTGRTNYDRNTIINNESHIKNYRKNGSLRHREQNSSCNGESKHQRLDMVRRISEYQVGNKFWYYLFLFGTELGDETFYAIFIPFWFWNIDGAVGRRVIFLWSLVMYIGQSFKEIIRWSRPGPPVVRLQKKWGVEYGMPSTHAMVAFSIPFSVLIFTLERYKYPALVGLAIAIIWCSVICVSRIYLGMHNVLDIFAGLFLTVFLMFILVPSVDYLDYYILSSPYSPLIVLFVSIMLIIYHPRSDKWTPTRGDTTMTVSVTAGIQIAAWINYQLGDMVPTKSPPPYEIIWPTYQMLGLLLLRTVLGMCCLVAARAISKSISYAFVCAILGKDKNELRNSESTLENKNKTIVELCYKYFTYGMIGFNTQYLLPNVFKLLGIGRPDFYTEI